MHWSEKIARTLIERKPNKEEYVCAAGISPSGSVHIGNFRDIVTSYYVVKSLQKLGKKAKLLFSWDNFDRLRKVPVNVSNIVDGYEKYIGMPYTKVPNPFKTEEESYAKHFENEFEAALKILGIDNVDIKYQSEKYLNGDYTNQIIHALKNRKEIYDITMSFKTQETSEEERENYYPISVYCDKCFKDSVKVLNYNENTKELTFKCLECGEEKTVNIEEYKLVKLSWKVDWPMRWEYEGVDFEPGGIDHAANGGSYQVSSVIAKKIFNYEAPVFQGYGWLGIQGLGSMHSSSGMNLTPKTILSIYEPEIVRWLFSKYEPKDAFNFCFDETILRHYSEFDKLVTGYLNNTIDEFNRDILDLAFIKKPTKTKTPFGILSSVSPICNFNKEIIKTSLNKAGVDYDNESLERLDKVEYWLKNYMPNKIYKVIESKNEEYYNNLTEEEKDKVKKLYKFLKTGNVNDVQQYMYDLINNPELSKKENLNNQMHYFKIFYNLLFGQDDGPRLYLFFMASNSEDYLKLLNF
ncbi:MAG: lysine--tRNA ligase [Clostridiales bacterium]|nr:lysine--tRNA ligase [Clostridiales bacterium]